MIHHGSILIHKENKTIKVFRYWNDTEKNRGKVEITWKDDDGEKHTVMKEYQGTAKKPAVIMYVEAVIRFWPKYCPQKHETIVTSGHPAPKKKS